MKLILKLGLLAAVLTMCVGQSAPALALGNPSLPANGCLGGKIKCVIKKKACLLGLYKKSATPDPLAIAKCKDKFQVSPAIGKGCFEKLDAKGGCVTTGDAGAMEAKIDAHVGDLVAELYPTAPGNKCQFGKTACVLKYNSCVLGLFSKAAKAGGPIDGTKLPKCTDGLTACIGKLETKYPQISSPDDCLTYNDINALRNKDDAFIDDVVAELASGKDQNNQRCTNDTSVHCTTAPGGGGCGAGTCEFWFGAPLSLAAGGVTTCVTNQWNGGITGTFDQQGGASVGTASVLARVYNGIVVANPCPRCIGDNFPADGAKGGTCNGGQRNGQTCDGDGQSPEPSFGTSSLDCPPTTAGIIATIPVDLTNTNNGTVTKTVDATSPNCNGAAGKKCLCATCSGNPSIGCDHDSDCAAVAAGTCTNNAGEPRKPNACVDDSNVPGDGTICTVDGGGEGHCAEGPPNQHCHIETFRGCTVDGDCPFGGIDTCDSDTRDCFPGSGNGIGDSVSAVGSHEGPRNHAGVQTFGSVFCTAHTSAAAVNSVAGLPGPGRLALKGVGAENGISGTGGACPTVATFLPTTKLGVLDTGWTGISHDAKVIGGGKVTVAVTGCSAPGGFANDNCGTCSYTGPVANPNAMP